MSSHLDIEDGGDYFKTMFHVIAHPDYDVVLPEGHRFHGGKFIALMHYIIRQEFVRGGRVSQPRSADPRQLAMVHEPEYITAIRDGNLSRDDERRLGLPWSEKLAMRSFLAVEGTYKTCIKALEHGLACHAAGGTHHAHRDHGAGFCVFNDMAFAAKRLLTEKKVKRVLILDADVHQGDGTADILTEDRDIYTCSLHCGENYPYEKAVSDHDVILPDGLDDDGYLKIMVTTLALMHDEVKPDLVIYDAGVDVHRDDVLGRLEMTGKGIMARDEMVLSFWARLGVPVATVIGGGYAKTFDKMIALHSIIFEVASRRMKALD